MPQHHTTIITPLSLQHFPTQIEAGLDSHGKWYPQMTLIYSSASKLICESYRSHKGTKEKEEVHS